MVTCTAFPAASTVGACPRWKYSAPVRAGKSDTYARAPAPLPGFSSEGTFVADALSVGALSSQRRGQACSSDLAGDWALVDAERTAAEADRDRHGGTRTAHRVEHRAARAAGGAHDACEQRFGFLRGGPGRLGRQRRIGVHRRAVRPDAAEPTARVSVVAIRLAGDHPLAVAAPIGVDLPEVHAQAGICVRLSQRAVLPVPDQAALAGVEEDGLMRDARAVAPAPPVAGHPDHFAGERSTPEDAVGGDLGLVHRMVAQVQPQAATLLENCPHGRQPWLEHLDEGVDSAEMVAVRQRAACALDTVREPSAALAAGVERRIDVNDLETSPGGGELFELRQAVRFDDLIERRRVERRPRDHGHEGSSANSSRSSSAGPSSGGAPSQLHAGPPPSQPATLRSREQAMRRCRWSS